MTQTRKQYRLLFGCKLFMLVAAMLCFCFAGAQDDCSAAKNVTLAGGGYGIGLVTSSVITITSATVQPGETFSPTNSAAGQTDKTIWYKFNLPTSRSVTIRLAQNTPSIASGDVGFAVYKTSSCTPGNSDLSTQLSPVTVFGTTTSSCLQPGDYLVQVAAKSSANGSVYIQIQTGLPATSPFDFTTQAYDFGSLATGVASVNYRVECQSVDNASEVCTSLPNYLQYTKTSWHVFTTPNYFDYISLVLANQGLPAGQTFGFNIYKGDVRSATGTLVSGCNSFTTNAYKSAQKTFTCSDLDPNTTYSIQIFYHQNFTDNVQLSLVAAGTVPTALPQPLLSSLIGNNTIALTPTTSGSFANPQDYFGCNSRHALTACTPAIPSAGINYGNRNFNLSSFFSIDLSSAASVTLGATPTCGPPLLVRLFHQGLTNNCSDLDVANLISEGIGSATLPSCLAAGKYVVQVSGTDSAVDNTFSYGTLNSSSPAPCLLSNLGSSFSLNVMAATPVPKNETIDSTLCSGQFFTLANGTTVNTSNTYRDTLRSVNGCDSVARILNLSFKEKTVQSFAAAFCAGQSYSLPSGRIVNTAGSYNDTLSYASGCDSLINIVTLSEKPVIHQTIDTAICEKSSFLLPSGTLLTAAGDYKDTVRYAGGCDSLVTELHLQLKTSSIEKTAVNICDGKSYTLPWGTVVTDAGEYRDTLHYAAGCDSLIRIVDLTVSAPTVVTTSASICEGSSYTLPSGAIVTTAGIYRDTLRNSSGCDSLIRITTLSVGTVLRKPTTVGLCEAGSVILPWGITVTSPGVFRDTLRSLAGCDSIINEVTVQLSQVTKKNISASFCSGASFTLPWGTTVTSAGIYSDTLRYLSGCDSLITNLTLSEKTVIHQNIDTSICNGSVYSLPSGKQFTSAGNYQDTIRYGSGCDSLVTSLHLGLKSSNIVNTVATICAGQTYTLPWGALVSAAGEYRDTLRYTTGCDSIIRVVQVTINSPTVLTTSATICEGTSYTLPWGPTVSGAGIYRDTLHYTAGCDSVIRIVNLSVAPVIRKQSTVSLCEGKSVQLPWGPVVSTAGTYSDTLRYTTGCDSLINQVTVQLNQLTRRDTTVSFCAAAGYTLPWGSLVTKAGTYRDTLRYLSGCDSLINTVQLTANTLTTITSSASICTGQGFTLPWGTVVNTTGLYRDTLRYAAGCDSVIRIVDLLVGSPLKQVTNATICSGKSFMLPWGATATAGGIYSDTLRSLTGCDSLVRVVDLSVANVLFKDTAALLCPGQAFIAPSGKTIASAGTYTDTLRYTSGCDSVVFRMTITQRPLTRNNIDAAICSGQSYTLPSGKIVVAAAVYSDTLRYASGCDSVITTVNLSILTKQIQTTSVTICEGKNYTLPWGTIVNAPGKYMDTLKSVFGCDSIVRIVQLSVMAPARTTINNSICTNQVYTMPSGKQVNTAGDYMDTVKSVTGCDSIIYMIHLTALSPATTTSSMTICPGRSYTLPWGQVVTTGGMYRDTTRSVNGCDSMYRIVNLSIFAPTQNTVTASVCYGDGYKLPSGRIVYSSGGVYKDTIFSASGCDSVISTITLSAKFARTENNFVTLCPGQTYTLPWGRVVNQPGSYADTLKYTTGCDSLIRQFYLQPLSPRSLTADAAICQGDIYRLPWGPVVTRSGIYSDTLRTMAGCDSFIRTFAVYVRPRPVVTLSKSNDINCTLGSARLTATGGQTYSWSPSTGLDRPDVADPLAAPAVTTTYHVLVSSAAGCKAEDSVQVVVSMVPSDNSFLVPNAFTPNGDGLNDCFGVRNWGAVTNLRFYIYDRWGKQVFYTENVSQCWDGTLQGTLLPTGTYVYAISARTACGDVVRKGTVTLVR